LARSVNTLETIMKNLVGYAAIALALALALAVATPANAKGCLKGAAIGGAAGHFAGHHGVLGAAAGCLIGRHKANTQSRETTGQNRDERYTGREVGYRR
jgi:hypothetical protein